MPGTFRRWALILEWHIAPVVGANKLLEMSNILGDHDTADRQRLGCKDHIPVQGFDRSCRSSPETSLGPESRRPAEGVRLDRQIIETLRKTIQVQEAPGRGTSTSKSYVKESTADLVVNDFR